MLLLFGITNAHAQFNFKWASVVAGEGSGERVRQADKSTDGTILTVGDKQGRGYLAKNNSVGTEIFFKTFESGNGGPMDLTIDKDNNILVAGYYASSNFDIDFSNEVLKPSTSNGFFMAKYAPDASLIWGKFISAQLVNVDLKILSDKNGDIFLAGNYSGAIDLDPGAGVTTTPAYGSVDVFLAKYNATGDFLWGHGFGGSGLENFGSIELDLSGNVLLAASFPSAKIDLDPSQEVFEVSRTGVNSSFFAKYNSEGSFAWGKVINSDFIVDILSVRIDESLNIFIGGRTMGTTDFDPSASVANLSVVGEVAFLAKYDASGNYNWIISFKEPNGNYSNAHIQKIDFSNNEIHLAGKFSTTIDFDAGLGLAVSGSHGEDDIFYARYTSDGKYIAHFTIGGTKREFLYGIIASEDKIYLAGSFQETIDLDPTAGAALFTSPSTNGFPNNDGFLLSICNLPVKPEKLNFPLSVLRNQSDVVFKVKSIPGVVFAWEFPEGFVIVSGEGTNTVIVNIDQNAANGTINVLAFNECGEGEELTSMVTVKEYPEIIFDNISKTYGDVPFTLLASSNSTGDIYYEVLPGGTGQVELSGSEIRILNAGTVNISAVVLEDDNYISSSKEIVLTINKKMLTVTADNKTKIFGFQIPELTFEISGFVNAESDQVLDELPQINTSANALSNTGDYVISFSGGLDNNYDFTFVNGVLKITKAPADIYFSNLQQTFDGTPKAVTVITSPEDLQYHITYNGSDELPVNPGMYSVYAEIAHQNYFGTASEILTIDIATGADHSQNNIVSVFPNPTESDVIYISGNDNNGKPAAVVVTDVMGKSTNVPFVLNNQIITVDLTGFDSGHYIIKLMTEYGIKYLPFIRK